MDVHLCIHQCLMKSFKLLMKVKSGSILESDKEYIFTLRISSFVNHFEKVKNLIGQFNINLNTIQHKVLFFPGYLANTHYLLALKGGSATVVDTCCVTRVWTDNFSIMFQFVRQVRTKK